MKIQELRTLLSAAERGNLEKAFAETYKQLWKGQKEELDLVITNILQGKTVEKKAPEKRFVLRNWSRTNFGSGQMSMG